VAEGTVPLASRQCRRDAPELAAEKIIIVSLRTVEQAVAGYRQELLAEARATVRFETAPGRQMQGRLPLKWKTSHGTISVGKARRKNSAPSELTSLEVEYVAWDPIVVLARLGGSE
jgi:hypothetical protein